MFRTLLAEEFSRFGALTEVQLDQLEAHYDLLSKWNERLNLTRIRRMEDVVRYHYCESLYLGRFLPEGNLRVADVGSGAGFPGIPIAILRPDIQMSLVESHQRKAVFLREAARHLPNVAVLAERAEGLSKNFEWVVSRAVDPREILNLSIARNVAILIGSEDARSLSGSFEHLPWGENRVLFHVERAENQRAT